MNDTFCSQEAFLEFKNKMKHLPKCNRFQKETLRFLPDIEETYL